MQKNAVQPMMHQLDIPPFPYTLHAHLVCSSCASFMESSIVSSLNRSSRLRWTAAQSTARHMHSTTQHTICQRL